MFICHQPYSEALEIPFNVAIDMMENFNDVMEGFTGKKKKDKVGEFIKGLPAPEKWGSIYESRTK